MIEIEEEYECSLCGCTLDKKYVNENFAIHFCEVCKPRIDNILRDWHCSAISDESMAIMKIRQDDKIEKLEKENKMLREEVRKYNWLTQHL